MARWQTDNNFTSRSLVRAPASPSVTSTSSDDREEFLIGEVQVPMVRHHPPPRRPYSRHNHAHQPGHHHHHHSHYAPSHHPGHHHHHHHHHQPPPSIEGYSYRPGGTGTLRSTRSVPALALATWDGEPCPVHGHHGHAAPVYPPSGPPTMRRYGSLYDMRPMLQHYPPPPPSTMHLERKSIHGSMQMLNAGMLQAAYPLPAPVPVHFPPPPQLAGGPPGILRPRPIVFPAGAEPLPMRDPYKGRTPPPGMHPGKMDDDSYSVDHVCCRGHLIVLWIILGVVTAGVILGIILGVTIA